MCTIHVRWEFNWLQASSFYNKSRYLIKALQKKCWKSWMILLFFAMPSMISFFWYFGIFSEFGQESIEKAQLRSILNVWYFETKKRGKSEDFICSYKRERTWKNRIIHWNKFLFSFKFVGRWREWHNSNTSIKVFYISCYEGKSWLQK